MVTAMVILLILLAYMIFNFGSPNGLQRYILPNPDYDLYLLVGLGFCVFVLNLLIMKDNDTRRGGR